MEYWRDKRGEDRVTPRAAIDPGDFTDLLPQVFILGRHAPGQYAFRLVGGFVSDLHKRDLRQDAFLTLWAPTDRLSLQTTFEAIRKQPEPAILSAHAHPAAGAPIGLEIMLAPLANTAGEVDRYLGLYQPTSAVARLMGRPVQALTVREINRSGPLGTPMPRLRLAALDGKRIA